MVAYIIAMTSWLGGEVGVRLGFIFLGLAIIFLLYSLTKPKDEKLFFLVLGGIFVFHIGGFFAAPDTPLLFFCALYLWLYRLYFYEDKVSTAIFMGLALGGMALSKYQSIIFFFFVLLSNIEVFKRKTFYLTLGIATLMVLPHFWWQYAHDFVTFDFHLFNRRGATPFSWAFPLEYLFSQILLYGPLLGLLLFPASIKYETRDHYDCAMKYSFFGIFLFFLLMSFRGRAEGNWTVAAFIPLIYMGYQYIESEENWRKWTYYLVVPSILFCLAFRLMIMWDVLPEKYIGRNETHGYDEWVKTIQAEAGDKPLVVINSYKKAARYEFATGISSYSLSKSEYSGNQYDLWHYKELALQGQPVFLMSNEIKSLDSLEFTHRISSERYRHIPSFRSFNYVQMSADLAADYSTSEEIKLELIIENKTKKKVDFRQVEMGDVRLIAFFHQYEEKVFTYEILDRLPFGELNPNEQRAINVRIKMPPKAGNYKMRFSLFYDGIDGMNSRNYRVEVR